MATHVFTTSLRLVGATGAQSVSDLCRVSSPESLLQITLMYQLCHESVEKTSLVGDRPRCHESCAQVACDGCLQSVSVRRRSAAHWKLTSQGKAHANLMSFSNAAFDYHCNDCLDSQTGPPTVTRRVSL